MCWVGYTSAKGLFFASVKVVCKETAGREPNVGITLVQSYTGTSLKFSSSKRRLKKLSW